MKREIKFRGKHIYTQEWYFGCLLECEGNTVIRDKVRHNELGYLTHPVIPETVGQFTGRYDKNDKEIFERDIVVNKNIHGKKWIVEYRTDSEYVGFVLKEIGTNGISLFTSWNDIEVIGNIHDNKELLQ